MLTLKKKLIGNHRAKCTDNESSLVEQPCVTYLLELPTFASYLFGNWILFSSIIYLYPLPCTLHEKKLFVDEGKFNIQLIVGPYLTSPHLIKMDISTFLFK